MQIKGTSLNCDIFLIFFKYLYIFIHKCFRHCSCAQTYQAGLPILATYARIFILLRFFVVDFDSGQQTEKNA